MEAKATFRRSTPRVNIATIGHVDHADARLAATLKLVEQRTTGWTKQAAAILKV